MIRNPLYSKINSNHLSILKSIRFLSSLSNRNQHTPGLPDDHPPLHLLDQDTKLRLANRHTGIIVNPESLSQKVLPYDQILKTNSKTGAVRLMDIERSLGYFWTLTDLKKTLNKPILSNKVLIPVEDAKTFPSLGRMGGKIKRIVDPTSHQDSITLPHFFTLFNRSKDPAIECTLVSVSFNDYGYQMIPSWTAPFRQAFCMDRDWANRTKIFQLIVHEGRILSFLESMITRSFQRQTPRDNQSSILLYFTKGQDDEYLSFRDVLRMHNNKTAYVFLLDGIGRVRFAASGKPSQDEIQILIEHAKTIVPALQ